MSKPVLSCAWSIFCVMAAAKLFNSLQLVGLATVSGDVAQTLRADAAALGLLGAAYSWTYAALQIPSGILVDTAGSRRCVSLALVIAAAGTLCFALSESLFTACAGRVLTALGLSFVSVPLMKLISVWFPVHLFGRMTALALVVGSFGYWAATTPVAALSEALGWRAPFLGMATLLGILAVLVHITVRDAPPGNHSATVPLRLREIAGMLKTIVSNRQVWLLGFWYLLQGGFYFSFVGLWAGQYLTCVAGMDATTIGWVLAPAAIAIITTPIFTWIAAATGKRKPVFLGLSIASTLLSIPLATGLQGYSAPILCALFFLLATAATGGVAVIFDGAKSLFPLALSGTVCGFINMFPLIGGALMQQGIGSLLEYFASQRIAESTSFTLAFLVYPICALLSLVLAWNYRELEC